MDEGTCLRGSDPACLLSVYKKGILHSMLVTLGKERGRMFCLVYSEPSLLVGGFEQITG